MLRGEARGKNKRKGKKTERKCDEMPRFQVGAFDAQVGLLCRAINVPSLSSLAVCADISSVKTKKRVHRNHTVFCQEGMDSRRGQSDCDSENAPRNGN